MAILSPAPKQGVGTAGGAYTIPTQARPPQHEEEVYHVAHADGRERAHKRAFQD